MKPSIIIDSISNALLSFDGRTVRDSYSNKKLSALLKVIYSGPERDYYNFTCDMYTSIRQERDTKNQIQVQNIQKEKSIEVYHR